MKKSNRIEASRRNNGVDMMSNMPDPILQLILSGLPSTEEVVRTSILSTQWRVLVDQTLDLESVRLCCANHYSILTVGRWIHAAVVRKVKLMDLSFCPNAKNETIELPHCLVTCDSLEVLRLFLYGCQLSLPTVTGFPALRVLELNSVRLSDNGLVKQIFESWPLLEDLSLIDCLFFPLEELCISSPNLKTFKIDNQKIDCFQLNYDDDGLMFMHEHDCLCKVLRICCPKLVYLEYAGHAATEFSFENIGSLKKALIYPNILAQMQFLLGHIICELFAGVSHVESLSLNLSFIQAISVARDPNIYFRASLLNLKSLEIFTTIDDYAMNVVMRILRCSPNLESFHLIIEEEEEIFGPEPWKLDEVLTRNLKRVEFLEFKGEKGKLDMTRFLLEHGNELEEMVFSWRDKVYYHEKSTETMKEVMEFYNGSSSIAKLITLLKD